MSTLAEVEAAIPQLSAEELAELERLVAKLRREKESAQQQGKRPSLRDIKPVSVGAIRSALDLPPLDLGRMLRPLGTREEWYDEMLEGRV
jgi:hypothetical protein